MIVDPLEAGIASGVTLQSTNGTAWVTTAPAVAGDITISVTPQTGTIRAGDQFDAPADTTPNLPITGNGGTITIVPDSGANHWFKL